MDLVPILAQSLMGLVILLIVFFAVPIKNTQLRVLVAVVAGIIGFFIVQRLFG